MYHVNNIERPMVLINKYRSDITKYPFENLFVGDFFDVPLANTSKHSVRVAVSYHNKKNRGFKKFSSKTVIDVIRVTRIY